MPDLINEKLESINQLFIEGLYFKALDLLADFERIEGLNSEDQISCYLLKSNLYNELGKYNDALKFAEQACNISQGLGNKFLLVDSYISKAFSLLALRDYKLILKLISEVEELLQNLTIKPQSEFAKRDALLKLIKSLYCVYRSRKIDKALEYGEKALKISEEYDNTHEITLALQANSANYFRAGNLERASNNMERCLSLQRTYRKHDDWKTLSDLGVLNGIRGELGSALEYTKQSLSIAEELGNKRFIAQCLNNSSLIYRQMGNLDHAVGSLKRSLGIWEEDNNKMGIIGGLDSLFIVSLDANSLKQAKQYFLRMQQINEQLEDKTANLACRVNKALILKMSSDSPDQEKAKEILQQIVKEEIINWEFTERALLHLCDIFLHELQTYNKQEVLSEIYPLIDRLLNFAELQNSYRLLAETNLLQGKLALIQMNMGDAQQLFTKAERIADEHGLHILARTISTEHDKLLEQLEDWENLRKIKAPISERLEFVEIDKTLNQMMRKKMIEPPNLVEEDPIILLIMDKHGNACFNHTFIKDFDHRDIFSSFISAFNTFSSEIFSESIDRIKIGKNVIFIKPVDPFLACYVSKGQSYPAKRKLDEFSDSIKDKSEIWEKLNDAIQESQILDVDNLPLLRTVVNELFSH
ncbi:MAG: tetratricopeptide repeat protein [Promethearchaeota archaeon]|jgi:tetratricopeptide (TPR) repeat protein